MMRFWVLMPEEQRRLWHRGIAFGLLALGALLVLFSNSLGYELVPKTSYGQGSFSWSPDDAKALAVNVRIIGGMVFAAGLAERLVGGIAQSKSGAV